jgi:hypothetical protein
MKAWPTTKLKVIPFFQEAKITVFEKVESSFNGAESTKRRISPPRRGWLSIHEPEEAIRQKSTNCSWIYLQQWSSQPSSPVPRSLGFTTQPMLAFLLCWQCHIPLMFLCPYQVKWLVTLKIVHPPSRHGGSLYLRHG